MAEYIGQDLGKSTSYAYYVAEGGTKTPKEYGEMLVNIDTVASRAEKAAGQAAESASSADQSKNNAKASADAAAASQSASAESATKAENKAGEAEQSASTASEKEQAASIDAETARRMAEQAAASAGTASGHAINAKSSEDAAAQSKAGAETAKTDAEAAKDEAVTAKGDAEQAKIDAQAIVDGIQAKSDQIAQNTSDIAELQEDKVSKADFYSAFPTDTASGAVASFPDGADNVPMESVKVAIEPIQDLHGQDAPYPAGGGKNLLDYGDYSSSYRITSITDDGNGTFTVVANENSAYIDHIISVIPNQEYCIKAESAINVSGNASQIGVVSIYDGETSSASLLLKNVSIITQKTFIPTGDKILVRNIVTGGAGAGTGIIVKPQLEKGSTATDWAPYENICPISWWTGVTVQRTGKNILKLSEWRNESDSRITIDTDNIRITARSYQEKWNRYNVLNRSACVFSFHVKTVSLTDSAASFAVYADGTTKLVGSGTTHIGNIPLDSVGAEKDITLMVPNGTEYISFGGWAYGGEVQISNLQLELGSTATPYEPYNSNTYSIDWQTEEGTVYGGTLDVVSGELVIDMAMVDLGTLNWTKSATQTSKWRFGADASGIVRSNSGSAVPNILCEVYATISPNDTYTGVTGISNNVSSSSLFICDLSISEVADLKAVINGKKVVYPLATPITIQLTPTEVKSLLGTNHVWADTGDVEVEYRADTKLYIEKLTAPTEDDMIADHAISANTFFMVGNQLFRATTAIASGATITVGTNATKLSLSDALNALA